MTGRPVLVTGASGLLGGWLLRTAPDPTGVVALAGRRPVSSVEAVHADLRDPVATETAVSRVGPSLVIHAAYDKDRASIVDATRHVAVAAAAAGADLVFVSTDAVFSGDGRARDETAVPDPGADYGRFKAQAERLALASSDRVSVVRLPLLVSVEPDDHVVGAIRDAVGRRRATTWFTDEIRRPAMAVEVAAALWRIAGLDPPERRGVWHLAGGERLSRYEIARRVASRIGADANLVLGEPTPAGSDRPRDLEFTDRRARAAIGWDPSPILGGHDV